MVLESLLSIWSIAFVSRTRDNRVFYNKYMFLLQLYIGYSYQNYQLYRSSAVRRWRWEASALLHITGPL